MSGLKKFGGWLAIAAGICLLIPVIVAMIKDIFPGDYFHAPEWVINLTIALIAIIGGVLGKGNRRRVRFLVLISGSAGLLFVILYWTNISFFWIFTPYSTLQVLFGPIRYITIETILIIIGGALMVLNDWRELERESG